MLKLAERIFPTNNMERRYQRVIMRRLSFPLILIIFVFCAYEYSSLLYIYPRVSKVNESNDIKDIERNESFEDKYFKRVLKEFKNNDSRETKRIFRQGTIPTFYLYTTFQIEDNFWQKALNHIFLNECPFHCKVTVNVNESSTADAIVFYLRHMKSRKYVENVLPKRDPNQPWIMLSFEGPVRANDYQTSYKDFNSMFNRTMTYRKDSDVIFNHGFIVSKEDAELLPFHWRMPPENITSVSYKNNKTIILASISNCDPRSGRLDYINELQKYINVDFYGRCGKLKCGHELWVDHGYKTNTDECLRKFGTSYMFYLAFENAFCTDYGTEKIYNLLYYPIVPIVFGGSNYEELLPPNSYINIAHYSPKELASYINFLVVNPNEYNKFFKWKEYYTPSTIAGEPLMCDLCTRLHDPKFYEYNLVDDFYKWFSIDAKCDRKWTIDNKYNLTYKPI